MLKASVLGSEDEMNCLDIDLARPFEYWSMFTCKGSILLLTLAGTLLPFCLANPVLQLPCESTEGCRSSKKVERSKNALIVTGPHSSDGVETRFLSRLAPRDTPPALLTRDARIASKSIQVSSSLVERNLSEKINHKLKLIWNEVGVISIPVNASNTYQKLYNGIVQNLNDPAFFEDSTRLTGRFSIGFAALKLFFENLPDNPMDL